MDQIESEDCVICFEINPRYVFHPCLHRCICRSCADDYQRMESRNFKKCPICRRNYTSIELYVPPVRHPESHNLEFSSLGDTDLSTAIGRSLEDQISIAIKESLRELKLQTESDSTLKLKEEQQLQEAIRRNIDEFIRRNYYLTSKSLFRVSQQPGISLGELQLAQIDNESLSRPSVSTGAIPKNSADSVATSLRGISQLNQLSPTLILHEIANVDSKCIDRTQINLHGFLSLYFPAVGIQDAIKAVIDQKTINSWDTWKIKLSRDKKNVPKVYELKSLNVIEKLQQAILEKADSLFYRVTILKYQISNEENKLPQPLRFTTNWSISASESNVLIKCERNSNELFLPLIRFLRISVQVDGNFTTQNSTPPAKVVRSRTGTKEICWSFAKIEDCIENDALIANFEFSGGQARRGKVQLQFVCEGVTLSGVNCEMISQPPGGLSIRAVKKKFNSGYVIC